MFSYLMVVTAVLRAQVETRFRRDEEGSVVEKVILTAIFAALAIAVGSIIVAKVTSKAQSITLN